MSVVVDLEQLSRDVDALPVVGDVVVVVVASLMAEQHTTEVSP